MSLNGPPVEEDQLLQLKKEHVDLPVENMVRHSYLHNCIRKADLSEYSKAYDEFRFDQVAEQ